MAKKESLFPESGGKLLAFQLGKQEYGIQLMEVREVVRMMNIFPVAKTPDFIKGLINLRGKVIPVIELRLIFQMKETEYTEETCIVVVDIKGELTGIIINFLCGVITSEGKNFEKTPEFGTNIQMDYIIGMVKLEDRVITVLDMERILSNEEFSLTISKAT